MTLEQLKETNPDLHQEVVVLCAELEITESAAAEKLEEIEQEDYLQNYAPAQRTLHAVKIFRAQAAAQLASNAANYVLHILATSPPDRGTKKDGTPFYIPGRVLAVGRPQEEGPLGLVNIAFFEDHEAKRDSFSPGTDIVARLTTSADVNPERPIYQCSVDASFSCSDAAEPVEVPNNFVEWVKGIIHHVPVAELENTKHHSKEYELRCVVGTVAYGNIRNTRIGPMATLQVFDDSSPPGKNQKRLSVRIPPSEFRFGTGSDIVAIGPLQRREAKDRNDDLQVYITLNANFVFTQPGGIEVPREAPRVESSQDTPTEDEEVDVSDFE